MRFSQLPLWLLVASATSTWPALPSSTGPKLAVAVAVETAQPRPSPSTLDSQIHVASPGAKVPRRTAQLSAAQVLSGAVVFQPDGSGDVDSSAVGSSSVGSRAIGKYFDRHFRKQVLIVAQFWVLFFVPFVVVVAYVAVMHDVGFRRPEKERALYNKVLEKSDNEGLDNMLDWIQIDMDGGIDEVPALLPEEWECLSSETFRCLAKTVAGVFNACMVCWVNFHILAGCALYYQGISTVDLPADMEQYRKLTGKARLINLPEVVIVATAELTGLAVLMTFCVFKIVFFVVNKGKKEKRFDAFIALWELIDLINLISTFSVLRLFSLAHPSVVTRKWEEFVAKPWFRDEQMHPNVRTAVKVLQNSHFIITRTLAVMLSFIAFGVKVAMVSVQFYIVPPTMVDAPIHSFFLRWAVVVALFMQAMGVMHIDSLLKWRLLALISGGQDAAIDEQEAVLINVYTARIAHAMYQEYWEKGRWGSFFVLFMNFGDQELQKLLLVEDQSKKERRLSMLPALHPELSPRSRCIVPRMATAPVTV